MDERVYVIAVVCRWCGEWEVKGGFDPSGFPHRPDCEAPVDAYDRRLP